MTVMPGAIDLAQNCTLEAYAGAKALPLDFLRNLGIETIPNPYAPRRQALRIPYYTHQGEHHRDRIRAALFKAPDGDRRMLWDKRPEAHGTIYFTACIDWAMPSKSYWSRAKVTRKPFGITTMMRLGSLALATSIRSVTTDILRGAKSSL